MITSILQPMNTFFLYLIQANVILAILFIFYKIFVGRDTFFVWRRFALLGMIAVSFILPLIPFSRVVTPMAEPFETLYATMTLPEIVVSNQEQVSTLSWILCLYLSYLIIFAFFAIRTLYSAFQIGSILMRSHKESIEGVMVHRLNASVPPFSFFRWICFPNAPYTDDQLHEMMVHEQTHVRQRHSVDILLIQLVTVLCWFNPFVWLMRREIRINHEFLAEESVVRAGANKKNYQYHLINSVYPNLAAASLYNNFNVLPLKKRIMMLNKKRTKSALIGKYLLFVPMIALSLLIVNCTSKAEEVTTDNAEGDEREVVAYGKDWKIVKEDKKALSNENEVVVVGYNDSGKKSTTQPSTDTGIKMPTEINGQEVFDAVEQMPEYAGGMSEMMKYLATSIKYPQSAKDANIGGRVIVQFIVDKSGKVTNVNVVRGVDPALDAEAVRVVSAMPNWKPGMQKGQAVPVKYTIPVLFKLD